MDTQTPFHLFHHQIHTPTATSNNNLHNQTNTLTHTRTHTQTTTTATPNLNILIHNLLNQFQIQRIYRKLKPPFLSKHPYKSSLIHLKHWERNFKRDLFMNIEKNHKKECPFLFQKTKPCLVKGVPQTQLKIHHIWGLLTNKMTSLNFRRRLHCICHRNHRKSHKTKSFFNFQRHVRRQNLRILCHQTVIISAPKWPNPLLHPRYHWYYPHENLQMWASKLRGI